MSNGDRQVSRKKGLGRGLDALLGVAAPTTIADDLATVAIDEIHRGPYQPRMDIPQEGLEELAASIRAQGVMQPIVLRVREAGGYEIIAGERRWRAAQLAELDRIPAVVKNVPDQQAMAMALVENIQREDLNPLEEARSLQRLQDEFGLTQQQVADAVGKSRAAVTNLLRLLNLAPRARALLVAGDLEMGHARALLTLPPEAQESAAQMVAERALSVRQTEALVRRLQASGERVDANRKQEIDPDTLRLESELTDRIGAPVAISYNKKGRGQLVIRYSNLDELDGILAHLV